MAGTQGWDYESRPEGTRKDRDIRMRPRIAWAEGAAPIVGASDRSDNAIVLWRFDEANRQL